MKFTLIITDASPLITLAKADALDVLLIPGWPIAVPDAVYAEAADVRFADGNRVGEWISANPYRVRIEPTEKGRQQAALWSLNQKARDFGELAALEVGTAHMRQSHDNRVVLLYEDGDLDQLRASINARVALLTTGSFLASLQRRGLIQSVDKILDDAERVGRNVERQRGLAADPDVTAALNERLDRLKPPR